MTSIRDDYISVRLSRYVEPKEPADVVADI